MCEKCKRSNGLERRREACGVEYIACALCGWDFYPKAPEEETTTYRHGPKKNLGYIKSRPIKMFR